ncbi:MAG TPA: hypothetical protein VGO59_06645 [Verrucomicrobiae bacterium]
MGLLRFPSMANEALCEAADADLILCAVCQTQVLPPWIKRWFERWAASRQIADAAMALVAGDGHHAGAAGLASEMCQLAAQHNLTFIANRGLSPAVEGPFADCGASEHAPIAVPLPSNHAEELNKASQIVRSSSTPALRSSQLRRLPFPRIWIRSWNRRRLDRFRPRAIPSFSESSSSRAVGRRAE